MIEGCHYGHERNELNIQAQTDDDISFDTSP